jgi:hypothetical protein
MVDLQSRVCLSKKGLLEREWDKFKEQKGQKTNVNATSLQGYEVQF